MKYVLSFTAGSLLLPETIKVAELYLKYRDWEQVERIVIDDNIMQKTTIASRRRLLQDLKLRLNHLSETALCYLSVAPKADAKIVAFIAVIKTYQFIADFMLEVVAAKYAKYDTILLESDFINFYAAKADTHLELLSISENTRKKIKQVLFRILAEAGILDSIKSKNICRPVLSSAVIELLQKEDQALMSFLLFSSNGTVKAQV